MTDAKVELVARLRTGKRKCPSLEPTLSERPHSSAEWRELGRQAADALEQSDAAQGEAMIEAMRELLAGHDNLYIAHFGPGSDPRIDIAAKAARAFVTGSHTSPVQGDEPLP